MSIFNLLTLAGGLAMFLYGMRLMGDGLKEGSSGALRTAMSHVTDSAIKAFLLGLGVTAVIQSSTATIVITSGLVGAGILTLRQSLGIIIGANVGTTVTGQIIRLLDIDSSSAAWLQLFKPSTLAPVALIIGIIFIMGVKSKNSKTVGDVAMGFGILFTGLLSMTGAVDSLNSTGFFEGLFASLTSPLVGYITGAGVAFVLQSSSATIGILQAFSASGSLSWSAIYAVIVGIYLGDCVTTAIVCSIGAREDAKRVGIVNILFNLSETVVVLAVVAVVHRLGLLDSLWGMTVNSGDIANTNTIFNLGCAVLLFPMLPVYEKLSYRIIPDKPAPAGKYDDLLEALSPAFFDTPALAFSSCYKLLLAVFRTARNNIERAFALIAEYDESEVAMIQEEETAIDMMTDRLSDYLVALSPHITLEQHIAILDHYYKVVTDFERLGDHAVNIAEMAQDMRRHDESFSEEALRELEAVEEVLWRVLYFAGQSFEKRDAEAAMQIEPLEQVMDDLIEELRRRHLARLYSGRCTVYAGSGYMNLLSDIERICDVCSNVGVGVVARVYPDSANLAHHYIATLHSGSDSAFNEAYNQAHDHYFSMLQNVSAPQND